MTPPVLSVEFTHTIQLAPRGSVDIGIARNTGQVWLRVAAPNGARSAVEVDPTVAAQLASVLETVAARGRVIQRALRK